MYTGYGIPEDSKISGGAAPTERHRQVEKDQIARFPKKTHGQLRAREQR